MSSWGMVIEFCLLFIVFCALCLQEMLNKGFTDLNTCIGAHGVEAGKVSCASAKRASNVSQANQSVLWLVRLVHFRAARFP